MSLTFSFDDYFTAFDWYYEKYGVDDQLFDLLLDCLNHDALSQTNRTLAALAKNGYLNVTELSTSKLDLMAGLIQAAMHLLDGNSVSDLEYDGVPAELAKQFKSYQASLALYELEDIKNWIVSPIDNKAKTR